MSEKFIATSQLRLIMKKSLSANRKKAFKYVGDEVFKLIHN